MINTPRPLVGALARIGEVTQQRLRMLRMQLALMLGRLTATLSNRRRTVAIAGSIGLHLLLLLALLSQTPAGLSGRGGGGTNIGQGKGEGYAVDLYAVRPSAMAVQAQTGEDFAAITPADEVAKADVAVAVTSNSELPQVNLADAASSSLPTALTPNTSLAPAGGAGQNGVTAGAGDDLWNAIAPCWRRIADRDTLPVTLEVTFSGDGHLAKPPVIDRDPAAGINPQSLQSEAKAIAALANCGAYAMAAGKEGVRVSFPRP